MKKIRNITAVLGLLGALVSCDKAFQEPTMPGDGDLRLELFCAAPTTKAAADPVPGTGNENLIDKIDYFFFADENSAPIWGNQFEPTSKTAATQLIEIKQGAEGVPTLETLFPNKKAIFFAVANYQGTEVLTGKTLKQLKQIAIDKSYGTAEEMTGTTGTKKFVMTAEQEITPNVQTAKIPLKRIAAKISLTANLQTVETKDGNETTTWTPIWEVARVRLENEATKALLGAGASYADGEETKYYLPADLALTNTEYEKYNATHDALSFYSMPNRWEEGAADAPALKFILRWQMETKDADGAVTYRGISDERYYKIMLPGDLTSLDANCWYKLTASVSVSAAEKEPVLTLDGFRVQAWNGPEDIVSADIKDAKYITPELSNVEFIGNSYTLSYYATGPVEVSNLSIYRVKYESTGEGKLELITNNAAQTANINSLQDNTGDRLTEAKVRAWESLNDETRAITINHLLCNDYSKKWFDALPYVYEITLHLTGENTSYDKKVIIRQYPNFTLRQIESNSRVFVNEYNNRQSRSVYATNQFYYAGDWRQQIGSLTSYTTALNSQNNNSKYLYLVSAAVSDDFNVLDPRNTTADNTVNTALDLSTYKATRSINAVAPLFIIASSYGKTSAMVYDAAKVRCAAYQENGYPAGRWRLPTEKEIEFLITLRKNGYITELFHSSGSGDESGYWASSGKYYNYESSSFVNNNNSNTRREFARCIYDAWYWGAEPLDKDGKKTTNTNAATNWLGYQFANKISN